MNNHSQEEQDEIQENTTSTEEKLEALQPSWEETERKAWKKYVQFDSIQNTEIEDIANVSADYWLSRMKLHEEKWKAYFDEQIQAIKELN